MNLPAPEPGPFSNGDVDADALRHDASAAIAESRAHLAEFGRSPSVHRDIAWDDTRRANLRSTAEYFLMLAWFGLDETPVATRCVFYIRDETMRQQREAAHFPEVGTLLLVRLCLLISGEDTDSDLIHDLDATTRVLGGVRAADVVAQTLLAIFGQIPFDDCQPSLPEWLLLPNWVPGNLSRQYRWSRTRLIPLSILWSVQPRKVSTSVTTPSVTATTSEPARPWQLKTLLRVSRWAEKLGIRVLRPLAIRTARMWIVTRASAKSGISGCTTSTCLSAIALNCLGYERSSPPLSRCFEALSKSLAADGGIAARRPQVYETAMTTRLLLATDWSPVAPEINSSIESLLENEASRASQWNPGQLSTEGGWPAEEDNDGYADVEATATVLLAMRSQFAAHPASQLVTDDSMVAMIRANSSDHRQQKIALLDRVAAASRRARRWLLSSQKTDGSWINVLGDPKDARWQLVSHVPNPMETRVATTGIALESLGAWEMRLGQTPVDQAVQFLRDSRSESGAWTLEGTPDMYSTAAAVMGLRAVGVPAKDELICDAVDAVIASQQPTGGWSHNLQGATAGDALNTAFAVLLLIAANAHFSPKGEEAIRRGIRFLIESRTESGRWPSGRTQETATHDISRLASCSYPLLAITSWSRVVDQHIQPAR